MRKISYSSLLEQKQGSTPLTYLAYLLRLWRDDEVSPWWAMVEQPHTGGRQAFPDLQSLFAFLEEQTGAEGRRQGNERDNPGR